MSIILGIIVAIGCLCFGAVAAPMASIGLIAFLNGFFSCIGFCFLVVKGVFIHE